MTYLICKLGKGHHGVHSPRPECPCGKYGWFLPKGSINTRANVWMHWQWKWPIFRPYRSSRSRSRSRSLHTPHMCQSHMYVLYNFGDSGFNSKVSRAKSVFFALVDPVTYLICKLGQGHHSVRSPRPECSCAKYGGFRPRRSRDIRANVRTHAHTHTRTHGRTEISTISPFVAYRPDGG